MLSIDSSAEPVQRCTLCAEAHVNAFEPVIVVLYASCGHDCGYHLYTYVCSFAYGYTGCARVCKCVWVCKHVCTCVYTCLKGMSLCSHMCKGICTHLNMCFYIHSCTHEINMVCVHVCSDISEYTVCVPVCRYTWVYIHVWVSMHVCVL